jgi:hypothetical protein
VLQAALAAAVVEAKPQLQPPPEPPQPPPPPPPREHGRSKSAGADDTPAGAASLLGAPLSARELHRREIILASFGADGFPAPRSSPMPLRLLQAGRDRRNNAPQEISG